LFAPKCAIFVNWHLDETSKKPYRCYLFWSTTHYVAMRAFCSLNQNAYVTSLLSKSFGSALDLYIVLLSCSFAVLIKIVIALQYIHHLVPKMDHQVVAVTSSTSYLSQFSNFYFFLNRPKVKFATESI